MSATHKPRVIYLYHAWLILGAVKILGAYNCIQLCTPMIFAGIIGVFDNSGLTKMHKRAAGAESNHVDFFAEANLKGSLC